MHRELELKAAVGTNLANPYVAEVRVLLEEEALLPAAPARPNSTSMEHKQLEGSTLEAASSSRLCEELREPVLLASQRAWPMLSTACRLRLRRRRRR